MFVSSSLPRIQAFFQIEFPDFMRLIGQNKLCRACRDTNRWLAGST